MNLKSCVLCGNFSSIYKINRALHGSPNRKSSMCSGQNSVTNYLDIHGWHRQLNVLAINGRQLKTVIKSSEQNYKLLPKHRQDFCVDHSFIMHTTLVFRNQKLRPSRINIIKNDNSMRSNHRIPVHYCILEATFFEERGISIHMQISGRVFWSLAQYEILDAHNGSVRFLNKLRY